MLRSKSPLNETIRNRYLYLDVLKGLATLGVIFLHFNMSYSAPSAQLSKLSTIGARCPQLFFIISAFLTWNSFETRLSSWSAFYKSKFLRLAPMYYAAIIISLLLPCCRFSKFSVADYCAHFFFVNGFSPLWIHDILGVEWYIADLAIFFMLCPLIKRIIFNYKTSIYCFVVATLLSSFCLVFFNWFFSFQIQHNLHYEQYFHTFFIVHQLPVLFLGIILYYTLKSKTVSWYLIGKYCLVCIGILGVFIWFSLGKTYITSTWIAGILGGCLFLIFHKIEVVFNCPIFIPLIKVGRYSLGIFLFHWLIIEWFRPYVYPHGLLQWLTLLLICVLLSYFLSKLLEDRLRYLLNHIIILHQSKS